MALHPGIGSPVLDRLGPRDVPEVLSFLEDDPVLNVYLIALVLRDALGRPHDSWWGARRDGRLSALWFLGGHSGAVLPAGDDDVAHRMIAHEVAATGEPRQERLQVIGPRDAVRALREHYPGAQATLRLEREQTYMVLDRPPGTPGALAPELRTARREDYAFLYQAGAELRAEELLEDPRGIDPVAYARRVEEECRDGWTWLWRDGRGLCFRAGISALTPEAVQVSGVYVPPALRGRGIATRALGELCARLLLRSRHVCLFCNDINAPALALYERLGFRVQAPWASAFYVRVQ
ncbi:MAG: GNAT family N-acetyltransferase [Candidatus Eisenbacteria bacterium]